ncbi:MAG: 6-bladed beta-propeller [Balneolaceae bacterium]
MKKHLLHIVLQSLLLTGIIYVSQTQAQNISYSYNETLRLEGVDKFSEEYSFASPNFVFSDSENNIYVSDRRLGTIRKFNRSGEHQFTIGERGRGPGEFTEISAFYIDPSKDHLIVVDRMNVRASRFSLEGELLETHQLPEGSIISPWMGRADQEGNHYLYYRYPVLPNRPRIGDDHLIYQYSDDFSEVTQSFAEAELFGDIEDYFLSRMITGPTSGIFEIKNKEKVITAPFIFQGSIFNFYNNEGEWELKNTLRSSVHTDVAYEQIDASDPPEYARVMGTSRGTLAGIIYSATIGLHITEEGKLAHYVHTIDEEHRNGEIGVNLFNLETDEFLGYTKIDEFSKELSSDSQTGLTLQIKSNSENRIYLVDGRSKDGTEIVVAEINFSVEN